MISRFFIDRPIFAAVVSIVITLAGLAAMKKPAGGAVSGNPAAPGSGHHQLSRRQRPGHCRDGRRAAGAADQRRRGHDLPAVDFGQQRQHDPLGYFEVGRDPDQATIDVNNRVQAALSKLPEEVRRQGVTVMKKSSDILQMVTIFSPDNSKTPLEISNYALINVIDETQASARRAGDVTQFGAKDYSMRVWLRPGQAGAVRPGRRPTWLTPFASRTRSSRPAASARNRCNEPQAFTYTVTTQGRLVDPKEFEKIILRSADSGASLTLGDVARVELGAQDYSLVTSLNGQRNASFGIYPQPGANALDTAQAVRDTMARLAERFPDGIEYKIPYDTTVFVEVSIEEVIHTFFEALALVVLVVFIFLQNWRATLIPVLAIPVSLVGTFAGMYLLGFSINLLTLFGLVLAIGIVVDDAIVVIENVERVMRTEKISAREAAIKAMEEVTGPIIAIVLVLCAVFVPVGFLGGLSGEMYKQFAITIAVSVVISGIVALTLSPALCALLLKDEHKEPIAPFRVFNRVFDRMTEGYGAGVTFFLKRSLVGLLLFGGMIALTVGLFSRVPTSLVPDEDQGYVLNAYFPAAGGLAVAYRGADQRFRQEADGAPGDPRCSDLRRYGHSLQQ